MDDPLPAPAAPAACSGSALSPQSQDHMLGIVALCYIDWACLSAMSAFSNPPFFFCISFVNVFNATFFPNNLFIFLLFEVSFVNVFNATFFPNNLFIYFFLLFVEK